MQITELPQTIFRNIFHTGSKGQRPKAKGQRPKAKGYCTLDHQICVCVCSPWPDANTDRNVREMMTGLLICIEKCTCNFFWLIFCRCYNFLLQSHFFVQHIVLVTKRVYWNILSWVHLKYSSCKHFRRIWFNFTLLRYLRKMHRYAPHNDVSANDGPPILRWSIRL
jgi:hypothetical protein